MSTFRSNEAPETVGHDGLGDGHHREHEALTPPNGWLVHWSTRMMPAPSLLRGTDTGQRFSFVYAPDGAWCLLDGYLFDQAPGDDFAARALGAYQRDGDGFIEGLRGGYLLVVWDPSSRKLLVGRDALGLQTCFYVWKREEMWVSSDLDILLEQPAIDRQWNRVRIAEHLQSHYNLSQHTETYFQDIVRLPPAHILDVSAHRLSCRRYWDPVPPGFAWASASERAEFEPRLTSAVRRCLSVGADSLALSGGFDSIGIAAIAAQYTDANARLHALSLRFSGEAFDEGESQIAVARFFGMPQVIATMEDGLENENYVAASLAQSSTSPNPVISVWQSMFGGLLKMGHQHKLSNLLMGTGGDDILTVDASYGQDLLQHRQLTELWKFFQMGRRSSPFGILPLARFFLWSQTLRPTLTSLLRDAAMRWQLEAPLDWWRRRKQAAFPAWLQRPDTALQAALSARSAPPHTQASEPSAYIRALRQIPQAPLLLDEFDQAATWARGYGFTLLYPYFDQDLFSLTMRIHPRHLIEGGWSKAPLRAIVARRLPGVSLRKKKVDFTQMMHQILRSHGKAVWHSMRDLHMLDTLDLINKEQLIHMIDGYFNGQHQLYMPVWKTLNIESWLRARSPKRV